jgi:hypothetical protein
MRISIVMISFNYEFQIMNSEYALLPQSSQRAQIFFMIFYIVKFKIIRVIRGFIIFLLVEFPYLVSSIRNPVSSIKNYVKTTEV